MKSLIFVCVLLVCGSAQAQCVNGKCQAGQANWQPVARVVNVVDASMTRSVNVIQTSACVASHVTKNVVSRPVVMTKRIRKHLRSHRCGR